MSQATLPNTDNTTAGGVKEDFTDFTNSTAPSCFQCSKLCCMGYYFICKEEIYTFCVIEDAMFNCKKNDHQRKQITGQTEMLFRFLAMTSPVMVRSLPHKLIGALGNLKKYGLVSYKDGTIKKNGKKYNSSATVRENFVYLKQGV
jgi:hypothetical protein